MTSLLRRVAAEDLVRSRSAIDVDTLRAADAIVADVRERGEAAVREHGERLGDCAPGDAIVVSRDQLETALADLSGGDREVLERTAARIRWFAQQQRRCLLPLDTDVPGGPRGQRRHARADLLSAHQLLDSGLRLRLQVVELIQNAFERIAPSKPIKMWLAPKVFGGGGSSTRWMR